MTEFDAREQFAEAQVACLSTVSPGGAPHLVPVVFAVSHDVVYTAVDTKRKTTHRLRRLQNIEANPQVSMLVDHYEQRLGPALVGAGGRDGRNPRPRRADGHRIRLAAT